MSNYKEWEEKIMKSWEPEFVISSGSYKLDNSPALSAYNGIPAGSMVHLMSSDEGSFKTSMALHGAREIQQTTGGKIAFIDAEAGITGLDWIESMGIDTDNWILGQPETGEEAFDMAQHYIEDPDFKGVIIDSIDACVPETDYNSEYGNASIGNHAKLVTSAVRKYRSLLRTHQTILWVVNQMKVNLTQMGARGKKATGGTGLPFYAKINIEMKKTKSLSQLKDEIYIPIEFRVQRSKLGQSFLDIPSYAIQGIGIDYLSELRDFAEEAGILIKSGSWWKLKVEDGDDITLGQGPEACRKWVRDKKELILKMIKDGEISEDLYTQ